MSRLMLFAPCGAVENHGLPMAKGVPQAKPRTASCSRQAPRPPRLPALSWNKPRMSTPAVNGTALTARRCPRSTQFPSPLGERVRVRGPSHFSRVRQVPPHPARNLVLCSTSSIPAAPTSPRGERQVLARSTMIGGSPVDPTACCPPFGLFDIGHGSPSNTANYGAKRQLIRPTCYVLSVAFIRTANSSTALACSSVNSFLCASK